MLYAFKKTILTGAILSILSPWGLTQGQDLPDDSQTIHWHELVPKLDDIANAHDFDLAYLLENYFSEYDGEDYRKCMDNADRARADEIRICDSLSSDISRDHCKDRVRRDYDRERKDCSLVGERESQCSSGGAQASNQTHNEVNIRNSGNHNGSNNSAKKPRRK